MRLTLAGAGIFWMVLPVFAHAQVVPNPTSTLPNPTSSFPGPLEEPVQEPVMETSYAYPIEAIDPRLVRYLYIFAGTLAAAGIALMIFGLATNQALAVHDARSTRTRRPRA